MARISPRLRGGASTEAKFTLTAWVLAAGKVTASVARELANLGLLRYACDLIAGPATVVETHRRASPLRANDDRAIDGVAQLRMNA